MKKELDNVDEVDIDAEIDLDEEEKYENEEKKSNPSFFKKAKKKVSDTWKNSKEKVKVTTERKNDESEFLKFFNDLKKKYQTKNNGKVSYNVDLDMLEEIFGKNSVLQKLAGKNGVLKNDAEFRKKVYKPMRSAYKKLNIKLMTDVFSKLTNDPELEKFKDQINDLIVKVMKELPSSKKLTSNQKASLDEIKKRQDSLQKFSETSNLAAAGSGIASLKLNNPFAPLSSLLWLASAIPAHLQSVYSDREQDINNQSKNNKRAIIDKIYKESKILYDEVKKKKADQLKNLKETQTILQSFCYKMRTIHRKYGKFILYRKVKNAFFDFTDNLFVPDSNFDSEEDVSWIGQIGKSISKAASTIKNKASLLIETSDKKQIAKMISDIEAIKKKYLNGEKNKIELKPQMLKDLFGKNGILRRLVQDKGILANDSEFKNKVATPILNKYRKIKLKSLERNLTTLKSEKYSEILNHLKNILPQIQKDLEESKNLSPQQKYMLKEIQDKRNQLSTISNNLNSLGAVSGLVSYAAGPIGTVSAAVSAISWFASALPSLASKVYDTIEENIDKKRKERKNNTYKSIYATIKLIKQDIDDKEEKQKITKIVEDADILKRFAEQCQVYCENYGVSVLYRTVKRKFFSIIENFDTKPVPKVNWFTQSFKMFKEAVSEKASKVSLAFEKKDSKKENQVLQKMAEFQNPGNKKWHINNGKLYVNSILLKEIFGKQGILRELVNAKNGILKNDKEFISKVATPMIKSYKYLKLSSMLNNFNSDKKKFQQIASVLDKALNDIVALKKLSPAQKNQLKKIKAKQRLLSITGDAGNAIGGGASVVAMKVIPYSYVSSISWFASALTSFVSKVYENMSEEVTSNQKKNIDKIYSDLKITLKTVKSEEKSQLKKFKNIEQIHLFVISCKNICKSYGISVIYRKIKKSFFNIIDNLCVPKQLLIRSAGNV